MAPSSMPRVRPIVRALASVLAFTAGLWHSKHAVESWRQWREWRNTDPSGADFYWTSMQIELVLAVGCYVVAVLAWRLLRPHVPSLPVI
jgi:hypothetical protein